MPPPTDPFVCGLVLGAGGSKRLGRPKQTLPFRDGTLLGHVVGVARECAFDQLVVAIGGAAEDVRAQVDLTGAEVVVNDAYGEGCSSSIAAALAVVDPRCDVLVLMLGDQPGVTADTVARAAGRPRRRGARGVPLRRRARASDRVRARRVRRARGPARRQGRVAAARPGRRRRRRGAGRGTVPLDVDTPEDYAAVL